MNLLSRRFPTILGIVLLLILSGVAWWYLQNNKTQVSSDITPQKVRITNVTDSKFSVSWITSSTTTGYVEYGPVGQALGSTANDDRDAGGERGSYRTHHVTISELQPQTEYAFRIISSNASTRFDNNGTPYSVSTGPTIPNTPLAKSIYGEVTSGNGSPTGSIVYISLPGSAPVSTLVTSAKNYSFPLSTIRSEDLQNYIEYDASATVASITIESGTEDTVVTVTTANAEPVPLISLGQDADYRSMVAPIAQVEPTEASPTPTATQSSEAVTPGIFNVQPLSTTQQGSGTVTITNPATEGEVIAATKPEFRGAGPAQTTLSIKVQSSKPQTGTAIIASDGIWKWSPTTSLQNGAQTLSVAYVDKNGNAQTLTRSFSISNTGDPAFVSTPSAQLASTSPSPSVRASTLPITSPSLRASAVASARVSMPSTESGVPVTGVISPSLLTALLGFVIMVAGATLLVL